MILPCRNLWSSLPGWTAAPGHRARRWRGGSAGWSRSIRRGTREDLFAANALDAEGRNWTYLFVGPFADLAELSRWLEQVAEATDPLFHAIVDRADRQGRRRGRPSCASIRAHGVIEVGNINYSPLLQRTPAATEAMFLMMRRVFDELGYRRYEWKCDASTPRRGRRRCGSGFQFEGIFRQAIVYKGRNRDTAWFSIIDSEWPALKRAFEQWLAPANFDAEGGSGANSPISFHGAR